jgi:hypothetical protein
MSLRAECAIAGLYATWKVRNFDHSNAIGFAVEAVELALAHAGLKRSAIEGLLVNSGVTKITDSDGLMRFAASDGADRPQADRDDEPGRRDRPAP